MEIQLMALDNDGYERVIKKCQAEIIAVTNQLVIVLSDEKVEIVLYKNDGRDYIEPFQSSRYWLTQRRDIFRVEVESFEARNAQH
jgi:hypothetical protein